MFTFADKFCNIKKICWNTSEYKKVMNWILEWNLMQKYNRCWIVALILWCNKKDRWLYINFISVSLSLSLCFVGYIISCYSETQSHYSQGWAVSLFLLFILSVVHTEEIRCTPSMLTHPPTQKFCFSYKELNVLIN